MKGDSGREFIDRLEAKGTAAILVTMPIGEDMDFEDLTGMDVRIQSSQSMTNTDTAHVLMAMAVKYYKHLGLLPEDFGKSSPDDEL